MRGGGADDSAFFLENYGSKVQPITIGGMSGAKLTCAPGKRIMSIGNNSYLNFENITFTGAHPINGESYGGALYIGGKDSEITLSNGTRITGNVRGGTNSFGGGVAIEKGKLTIRGAEISGNRVPDSGGNGGGLYAYGGAVVTIDSGLITANTASGMCGGVFAIGKKVGEVEVITFITINGGTISANQGSVGGGLVVNSYSNVTVNSGTITANISTGTAASQGGGGVWSGAGTFTMNGGTISGNTAAGNCGGGIFMSTVSSTVLINGGAIQKNKSLKDGGGIYVRNGTLTYTSGTISGNTTGVGSSGNSIYKANNGTVTGITLSSGDYEDGDIPLP